MALLIHVIGTDHEALYLNDTLICEAYGDELWSREYVLDVIDEYNIENVDQAYSPGTTSFPETLTELEENSEYKFDPDTSIRKRDSIANKTI